MGSSIPAQKRFQEDFCENRTDSNWVGTQAKIENPADPKWPKEPFLNNVIVRVNDNDATFIHLIIDKCRPSAQGDKLSSSPWAPLRSHPPLNPIWRNTETYPLSASSLKLLLLLCPMAPQWDRNHYPPTSCPSTNSPNVLTNPVSQTKIFHLEALSPLPPSQHNSSSSTPNRQNSNGTSPTVNSPNSIGIFGVPWRLLPHENHPPPSD